MMKIILSIAIVCFTFLSCTNEKHDVKFEKDGYFYIYATINDSIEGRFLLDTGASGLYFDSTFVSQHNSIIKSNLDTARMRGAGSTGYKQVFLIKDTIQIAVSNHTHSFTNSPILKLTYINGENIAGIIGNEFIQNQILIFDNEHSVLKIDSAVNPKNYETEIPFSYIDGRIYFPVDLNINENQKRTANLLMDLGCADAIILNSRYFNSLKAQNIIPKEIIDYTILYGGALGGNSNGGDFRITSIKLGNDIIYNPIISFSKDTLGAFSQTNYDGLLGNEILDRYNYAIDYRNQKLYLMKNGNSKKPFKSSLTGFYATKTNDIATVMSVYYQSEAYKNGLRLGDTIVSINNKKLIYLSEQEFYNELKLEGKTIKLTVLRSGESVDILFLLKYLL